MRRSAFLCEWDQRFAFIDAAPSPKKGEANGHQFVRLMYLQDTGLQPFAQDPLQQATSLNSESARWNRNPAHEDRQLSLPSKPHKSSGSALTDPSSNQSTKGLDLLTESATVVSNNASLVSAATTSEKRLSGDPSLPPKAQLSKRHSTPLSQVILTQEVQQSGSAPPALVEDTFDMSYKDASLLPVPPPDASSSLKAEFLHQQLDSLGMDAEIMPSLLLLGGGNNERLQGGAQQSL
jgi:hypothetical protein